MNSASNHKVAQTAPSSAAQAHHDRNYNTALYHANLIQAQKEVEAQVLLSTETLLDLPSSPTAADPSHPSLQDAALVRNSLRIFQPADYDALIEERNINKTCGYILCLRQNRVEPTPAKLRILYDKGKGSEALRVVEKAFLEKWCSDDCGRRALYIKVQLTEEPAWLRSAESSGDIVLLDESGNADVQLLEGMKNLNVVAKEQDVAAQMKALALERGDDNAPSRSFGLADLDVKEKMDSRGETPAAPNGVAGDELTSKLIEGYRPKHMKSKKSMEDAVDIEENSEDIIDFI